MFQEFNLQEITQNILDSCNKALVLNSNPKFELKAVFLADLVGATYAKAEYGHSKGMNRCHIHNWLATETIRKFNGTTVKYIGDAILATFPDNISAVLAAIAFRMALEGIKLEGEEFAVPLETRISLTFGTVEEIVTGIGNDIGGQVVDKAARLQEVTSPHQIIAEISVIEGIKLVLSEKYNFIKITENRDIGELQLKGIKEPVRVVEITTIEKQFKIPPSQKGQYISCMVESITSSTNRLWLSIRNPISKENRKDIALLQSQLMEAQKYRGVDVRILHNGWNNDTLKAVSEIEDMGLNVRFCENRTDSSVNLIDRNIIVFSSRKQQRFFMKNSYWKMISYHINSALANDFQKRWTEAISSRLQVAEILNRTFKHCTGKIDLVEIKDFVQDRFGIENGSFLDGCLRLLEFIRKVKIIFIVGRPGTGKSTIRKPLSEMLENRLGAKIKEMDDYDSLKQMFLADLRCERFNPIGGGGFLIKDPAVFNEVLKRISSDCLASFETPNTWVMEFARGHYLEAFNSFDSKILKKSVVIHMVCDKNKIFDRLDARAKSGGANVTEEVINSFYKDDDASEICQEMGIPCIEVENNTSANDLDKKLEMIYSDLIAHSTDSFMG